MDSIGSKRVRSSMHVAAGYRHSDPLSLAIRRSLLCMAKACNARTSIKASEVLTVCRALHPEEFQLPRRPTSRIPRIPRVMRCMSHSSNGAGPSRLPLPETSLPRWIARAVRVLGGGTVVAGEGYLTLGKGKGGC